jgi:long-chain fatty acid transport protein
LHRTRLVALCSLVMILSLLSPSGAFGNGFSIYEQGAKASGMGGAFTAQADDPSAIYFNPAGIMQLQGTQVMAGITAIMPTSTFKSDGNGAMGTGAGQRTEAVSHTWMVPHFYITHRLTDRIAMGVGTYSNFGLGSEWPRTFEGRYTTGVGKTCLETATISPVVGLKVTDRLSLGLGPTFQHLEINIRNMTLASPLGLTAPFSPGRNLAQTVESTLAGKDWDYGYTLGMRYQLTPSLAAGVSYLSKVTHNINNGTSRLYRLINGSLAQIQDATATLTLPASTSFGLAYKFRAFTLEGDAQWTEWSSYKNLRVDLANGTFSQSAKDWHNTWTLRLGGQYSLNKYLDLRAGFVWDETPIPRRTLDPLVPSGNRKMYCGGMGINLGKLTFDLAYSYLDDQDRRWDNTSGDVKTAATGPLTRVRGIFEGAHAQIFSLSARYRF